METCKICGEILDGNGHESATGGMVCHVCIRDERIAALRAELEQARADVQNAKVELVAWDDKYHHSRNECIALHAELSVYAEALKVMAEWFNAGDCTIKCTHSNCIDCAPTAALTEARKILEAK